jgi:2-polyprenyl-6-hydroxyphenyl methylase/3-demethylubiquinone-9 3-methyltransferase
MAIDNDMYSREAFGWWDDDADGTGVLLRCFINPIRFAYFMDVLEQRAPRAAKGRTILDVGCGGGYLCEEFARAGFDVTGIDPSRNTLAAANAHAAQNRLSICYQEGSAEKIPFDGASFDHVSCCDVLEHVDDIGRAISEIARVLKPGGLFFYDTINRTFASWLVMIKIAQDWKRSAWEAPDTHEWRRFVKPSELGNLLNKNGLAVLGTEGIAAGGRGSVIRKAIRERARGRITRYEMGVRFAFERSDKTGISYMGYAVKQ